MDDSDIPALSVFTDRVPLLRHSPERQFQLCPAMLLGSPQALPGAVKHIYSRLATGDEDDAMPLLVLALISHSNQFSSHYIDRMESKLTSLLVSCGRVWLTSSGEAADPLAGIAAAAVKASLPQLNRTRDAMHFVMNSSQLVMNEGLTESIPTVDVSVNTAALLSRREVDTEIDVGQFRAAATIRLAQPPPALLIGVPSEAVNDPVSYGVSSPILLSPSFDSRPLPLVIFAGASEESLHELLVYIKHGVPVLVLQDSCELCLLLHSASLLLRLSHFSHSQFLLWLRSQLKFSFPQREGSISQLIVEIFSLAFSDGRLIEFLAENSIDELNSKLIEMCLQCYSARGDTRQVLQIASRMNLSSVLSMVDVSKYMSEELFCCVLCECLPGDKDLRLLSSFLQKAPSSLLCPSLFMRIAKQVDQHFLTTILLSECLGYSHVPEYFDDRFIRHLDRLSFDLSFGIPHLFSSVSYESDFSSDTDPYRMLSLWCLYLHHLSPVVCLCSFSANPLVSYLILSRVAQSLAHQSHDWFFYEESLMNLSKELMKSAIYLLDSVYKTQPTKAYQLLCEPSNGVTITDLAFQLNSRSFIAHECCQKWLHRLLHGHLRTTNLLSFVPRWLKIIVSGIFVLPIFWLFHFNSPPQFIRSTDSISPAEQLLDNENPHRKRRTISASFSLVSTRSEMGLSVPSSMPLQPLPAHSHLPLPLQHTDSATPQSVLLPLSVEDVHADSSGKSQKKKGRHKSSHSLSELFLFYETPLVKYWLSLTFRLLHILFFAYAIVQPGCGNRLVNVTLWLWTFSWWSESFYVLYLRSQTMPLSLMPWRTLDCMCVLCFLLLQLALSLEGPITELLSVRTAFPSRILSSLFLLYWSYSTLIYYTPLSDIFGPLLTRFKLMLFRDFINFVLIVSLIMISSAVAMYALVYPDRPVSLSSLRSTLPSISYSLYSTDLSYLTSDSSCRNNSSLRLSSHSQSFCSSHLNRHSNPLCPSPSVSVYFLLFEYFIIIKLILWPILFAFFAKTAKLVDEEADTIWKFQMYALVSEFRLRPALPPPFTLLFFLCSCCCSPRKFFSTSSSTHPDMAARHESRKPTSAEYSSRKQTSHDLWRQKAMRKWMDENGAIEERGERQMHTVSTALCKAYEEAGKEDNKTSEMIDYINSNVKKIVLSDEQRPWEVLMPRYNPIFYCKDENEFAVEFGATVDLATEENLCELRKNWRNKQLTEMWSGKGWKLSAMGYPLNPHGRRGICGRGNHRHFGANRIAVYVIVKGRSKQDCMILTTNQRQLPTEEIDRGKINKDERLARILQDVGLPEGDAQMLSLRRNDPATPTKIDSGISIVNSIYLEQEEDTDNAWTEYCVWQVYLRHSTGQLPTSQYAWMSRGQLSSIPWGHKEIASQSIDIIYSII